MSALTTELPGTMPGMIPGIERHAGEMERAQVGAMAARYMSRERWDQCLDIVTHLTVVIPMPAMSLQSLLELKAGMVVEAGWPASHDVPLIVEGLFLASVELEPVGHKLGVRINTFVEQPRPELDLKSEGETPAVVETVEGEPNCTLEDIQLTPSLCFGATNLPMRDVLGLCVGDIVVLDRLVVAPVTMEAGGRTLATGELVLSDGGFAVRIKTVSEMTRHLPSDYSAF